MRIQQLPTILANQIAAGEVIERPASVVKELLENALDAGADSINIEIGYGGLTQIKIADNGQGIVAEDLPLAIAAHATSKISELKDLYAISSMGFRGEALASIASISRLTISSKPKEQAHAMMLSSSANGKITINPCARTQGTTIDVRDIFFNAPVRKKFLKSERSEFLAIELIVKRFALAAPQIAIHLSHNGKQELALPAANCAKTRLARIRKLVGKTFIDQSYSIDIEHAGLRLEGFISTKDYQRSQNDKLLTYVNNRMVKDKLFNHAIKQAYESILYPGRHPACLLYLTIKADEVDVNVHPTKHEVRFQQPRLVHDFISSQLSKALMPPLPIDEPQKEIENFESWVLHEPYSPPQLLTRTAVVSEAKNWTSLNHSFALLILQEQPYLVDVRALQQKWLVSILEKEQLPLAPRPLLVPLSYSIPIAMDFDFEVLNQLGIELNPVGENSVLIRSLPKLIPHLDLKQFLTSFFATPKLPRTKLFELLASSQSLSIQHLQQEETALLIDYVQTLAADKLNTTYCKHLSLETCRGLLNA